MRGTSGRHLSRVWRLLVPVVLILGVGAMHTLGHLESGHGSGGMGTTARHAAVVGPDQPPQVHARPDATGPRDSWRNAVADDGGHRGLDPTSVCLAVLTALSLLFLSAASPRTRRSSEATARKASTPSQVARPPPRRTALCLTQLLVLRI